MSHRIDLGREQVLAFRRGTNGLGERQPLDADTLRRAGWAGLQDSMPRAALLSIHARVQGADPSTWEGSALVQVWGPRYSTYVVPERDVAVFTLGRLPDDPKARRRAEAIADELEAWLEDRRVTDRAYADAVEVNHNRLRYAAPTGRVRIRWEGARAPIVWMVPAPDVHPADARIELARRYLHVFGPTSADAFAEWAGIATREGRAAFDALSRELVSVGTPIGDRSILAADEALLGAEPQPAAPARLLPSGDTFYLYWGRDRELLVPDPRQRAALWTSRVWPGALLVGGELAGTWRRAGAEVSVEPWRRLSPAERAAVEAEAATLPLPDAGPIRVRWVE